MYDQHNTIAFYPPSSITTIPTTFTIVYNTDLVQSVVFKSFARLPRRLVVVGRLRRGSSVVGRRVGTCIVRSVVRRRSIVESTGCRLRRRVHRGGWSIGRRDWPIIECMGSRLGRRWWIDGGIMRGGGLSKARGAGLGRGGGLAGPF